jgi:hypothetical protein
MAPLKPRNPFLLYAAAPVQSIALPNYCPAPACRINARNAHVTFGQHRRRIDCAER